MSQLARSDNQVSASGSLGWRAALVHFSRIKIILPVGLVVIGLIVVLPSALWAYNIDRASRAFEQGADWPEPRQADSLPHLRDDDALGRSLAHVAAAVRWQPADAYAHRLAGKVYAARKDWLSATKEFEHAGQLAPRNPLIAWERALVYEQLTRVVTSAPRENILPDLASVPIDAPDQPVDTVYCRDGGPRTCYVDLDRYTQPYAAMPEGPSITADVLFMHPPAGVTLTKTISLHTPALVFLMGLDPGVRRWNTDGATFEIWLTPAHGDSNLVFQQTLDVVTAKHGWLPGAVDLSVWAGQTVTLELRTSGGPAGNTTDDWYAWGNVTFTGSEAARYSLALPRERMVQAWQALELDNSKLVAYGDEALRLKQYDYAVIWYDRALQLEQTPAFDFLYRRAIAAINSRNERAEVYLAAAQQLNPSVEAVELSADEATRIDGSAIRWMTPFPNAATYGETLAFGTGKGTTAGYMWWTGEGVAVVHTPNDRNYVLNISVRRDGPPPLQLALGINGERLQTFSLNHPVQPEQMLTVPIRLQKGYSTINVWYLNETNTPNIDRNAVIQWITLRESR